MLETRTVCGALFSVASMIALVAACGSSDSATIPPDNDAGPTNQPDGSPTPPDGSVASDSGQDSGPATPVVDADCAAFADGYCDLLKRCYPILLGGTDEASCKARAGLGCAISIQSPGAAKPPQTCSAAVKAAMCTSNLTDIDPTCHVLGTIADASPCEHDNQCQSGSCPKKGVTGPCAVCAPRALENASCQAADCNYGLQCAGGICVKPVAKDGVCAKDKCAPPNRCVAGTCQTPKAVDATCTSAPPTGDDPCDAVNGQFCKPGALGPGKCAAITFADPGASCGFVNGGLVGCKGNAQCTQGKCVANADDGAACNTTSGPGCTGPAECLNGLCTFPSPSRCK
jgi:hypothetical protein